MTSVSLRAGQQKAPEAGVEEQGSPPLGTEGSTWLSGSFAKQDLSFTAGARLDTNQQLTRILNKPACMLGYNTRRIMARRSREVISSYSCWCLIPLSHAESPLASVAMFCVFGKWVKKKRRIRRDGGPFLFPESASLQVRLAIFPVHGHVYVSALLLT